METGDEPTEGPAGHKVGEVEAESVPNDEPARTKSGAESRN